MAGKAWSSVTTLPVSSFSVSPEWSWHALSCERTESPPCRDGLISSVLFSVRGTSASVAIERVVTAAAPSFQTKEPGVTAAAAALQGAG